MCCFPAWRCCSANFRRCRTPRRNDMTRTPNMKDDRPLILTVAPNGAYKTHEQHPAVPLTPEALADTAKACLDAGAAMIHMHVRRPDGRHLLDAQAYLARSEERRVGKVCRRRRTRY